HAINDAKLKLNHGKIAMGTDLYGKEIRITIADNGVGMDEQTLEQLLSGRSRSIKRGRHGLGFAFVLDECARNGFTLSASSKPKEGTIMTIIVPVTT
ncbi:MAG: ATP-binding protein, partial [Proteobacteria bacterium]|nr:ATP-binding protein [Pseudomonadota bacterium]